MASSSQVPTTRIPESDVRQTWAGYRQALARMGTPELMAHLAQINGAIEAQAQASMTHAVSIGLQRRLDQLDQLQLRSPRSTAAPPTSPTDRGQGHSQPSQRLGPLEQLIARRGLGPKLAARLVAASVRGAAERRREAP